MRYTIAASRGGGAAKHKKNMTFPAQHQKHSLFSRQTPKNTICAPCRGGRAAGHAKNTIKTQYFPGEHQTNTIVQGHAQSRTRFFPGAHNSEHNLRARHTIPGPWRHNVRTIRPPYRQRFRTIPDTVCTETTQMPARRRHNPGKQAPTRHNPRHNSDGVARLWAVRAGAGARGMGAHSVSGEAQHMAHVSDHGSPTGSSDSSSCLGRSFANNPSLPSRDLKRALAACRSANWGL